MNVARQSASYTNDKHEGKRDAHIVYLLPFGLESFQVKNEPRRESLYATGLGLIKCVRVTCYQN